MKILHLFSNHKLTGPAEPAILLAAQLAKRGHEVVFAHTGGRDRAKDAVGSAARAAGLVTATEFRLPKHYGWIALWRDMHGIGAFIAERGIEVVHCHLLNDHVAAAHARRYCGPRRPAVVRTNHEAVPMPIWVRTRYSLKRTDALIELSRRAMEADIRAFGMAAERVHLIDGAVDLARFDPGRPLPDVRTKLGLGREEFVVGVVARIQRHRRFDVLLEAASLARREVPRLKLLVIGRGTHQDEVAVGPAHRLGLTDTVVFPGYLRGDEYVGALAALDAKVFLMPGTDGSCRAARQAMAMGRPVIAARRGMLPELVTDGENGLVVDDTPENLAGAIVRLGGDRELRRRMGESARRTALERFDPGRQAERVEQVYRQVLASGKT